MGEDGGEDGGEDDGGEVALGEFHVGWQRQWRADDGMADLPTLWRVEAEAGGNVNFMSLRSPQSSQIVET